MGVLLEREKVYKNPRKYSGECSVENDVLNEQPLILHEPLLFIGFSNRPSIQGQSIASNRLPETGNRLPPIDCLKKQSIASSSTQIVLHPLELRVGPPRFFIVGSDQSSTTMKKLFDQQVDRLIS